MSKRINIVKVQVIKICIDEVRVLRIPDCLRAILVDDPLHIAQMTVPVLHLPLFFRHVRFVADQTLLLNDGVNKRWRLNRIVRKEGGREQLLGG